MTGEAILTEQPNLSHHSLRISAQIPGWKSLGPGKFVGIIFRYSDADNFYWLKIHNVLAIGSTYTFTSDFVHRVAGVDTVLSNKEIDYNDGYAANSLHAAISIGTDDSLQSVVRVVYYEMRGNFPLPNYKSHFLEDPTATKSLALPAGGKLGWVTNQTTSDSLQTAFGYLPQTGGPLGDEEGGRCRHVGYYHTDSLDVFLPIRWKIKAFGTLNFGSGIPINYLEEVVAFSDLNSHVTRPDYVRYQNQFVGAPDMFPQQVLETQFVDYSTEPLDITLLITERGTGFRATYRNEFAVPFSLWDYTEASPLEMVAYSANPFYDYVRAWPVE